MLPLRRPQLTRGLSRPDSSASAILPESGPDSGTRAGKPGQLVRRRRRLARSSWPPGVTATKPSSARTAGSTARSPSTSCQTRPAAAPATAYRECSPGLHRRAGHPSMRTRWHRASDADRRDPLSRCAGRRKAPRSPDHSGWVGCSWLANSEMRAKMHRLMQGSPSVGSRRSFRAACPCSSFA